MITGSHTHVGILRLVLFFFLNLFFIQAASCPCLCGKWYSPIHTNVAVVFSNALPLFMLWVVLQAKEEGEIIWQYDVNVWEGRGGEKKKEEKKEIK